MIISREKVRYTERVYKDFPASPRFDTIFENIRCIGTILQFRVLKPRTLTFLFHFIIFITKLSLSLAHLQPPGASSCTTTTAGRITTPPPSSHSPSPPLSCEPIHAPQIITTITSFHPRAVNHHPPPLISLPPYRSRKKGRGHAFDARVASVTSQSRGYFDFWSKNEMCLKF